MAIERDEILAELRELATAANLFALSYEIRGEPTRPTRKSFVRSIERAQKFLDEVDGPKVETGCICHDRTPGESLMGRPCKLHKSAD